MAEQTLCSGCLLKGGEYRIIGVLGQGGFGITYEADQVSLGRKVAIKEFFMKGTCERVGETTLVSVPVTENRTLVARFKDKFIREARLIAAMEHPHIVKIYDVFEENGTAYYVMESILGGSLSALVKTEGRLPENIAVKYIKQIGEALTYIHEQNVLHLDVKPSNILRRKNKTNDAVLIDFGISKHYDEAGQQTSSTPVGISEGYAPIEQYRSGDISKFSPATDVYSLGATLYFLVTGEVPPTASDIIADGGLKRPQFVSDTVWNAISAAMQSTVKSRPQSVAAFLALLYTKPTPVSKPAPVVPNEGTFVKVSPLASFGRNDKGSVIAGPSPVISSVGRKAGVEKSQKSKKPLWISVAVAAVVAVLIGIIVLGGGKTPSENLYTLDTISVAQTVVEPTPPVKEETFELIVSSTPSGAKVFINDIDQKKTTPAAINGLKAGTYKVTLKVEGYEEQTKSVSFKKGGTTQSKVTITLNKEAEKIGSVKIESTPAGASIYIDGLETGLKTPNVVENLAEGAHTIKLTLEGYNDASGPILITVGNRSVFFKKLEPKQQPALSQTGTENGHEWVDLGLSVKWATCNVGASTPGGYGDYFSWGEVHSKVYFDWDNYKYYAGGGINTDDVKVSKYNTSSTNGRVDNNTKLDLTDDAARSNWGGRWRIPTKDEWEEIIEKCTWSVTIRNGHKGFMAEAPNGENIFFPYAGVYFGWGRNLDYLNKGGYYWSSSLGYRSYSAWHIQTGEQSGFVGDPVLSERHRCSGLSIRPVLE